MNVINYFHEKVFMSCLYSNYHYAEMLQVSPLFETFDAANIFSYPVLYPTVLFTVFGLITTVIVIITYYRFRHQQVSV